MPCISTGLLCLTFWGLTGLCGSGWRPQHLKECLVFPPPQPAGAAGGLEGILAALGLSLCLSSKEEVLGLPVPPGTAFFHPIYRNDALDGR